MPETDSNYTNLCSDIFGKNISPGLNWLQFPYAQNTPEGKELLKLCWKFDIRNWKDHLELIKKDNVQGCLLEFGVYGGNSLEKLIRYCEELKLDIVIHGFDSFEGLPAPAANDLPDWWEGKFNDTSLEAVSKRLEIGKRKYVHLHKGWFSESLNKPEISQSIESVAYARIDCDLYQSTVDCLNFLEHRLSHGSILHFDDWTHNENQGETQAFFEFNDRVKDRLRFEHIISIARGSVALRVWKK